jgi:hypothetical protein
MAKPELYVAKPHLARAHPILDFREKGIDMRIKPYTLFPMDGTDFDPKEMASANGIVELAAFQGEILPEPSQGAGFSIMSEGILNICTWGGKFPSLLNQRVYTFERSNPIGTAARTSLQDVGTFCCWELGIANHEGAAWRRYLLSQRRKADKEDYFGYRFNGLVAGTV